jgi:deferrochelatase/peroxidase EfeB
MTRSEPDFGDIQGLVRFGYGSLTEACFLLVAIADPSAARAWLSKAPVANAAKVDRPPQTVLQVAFTREGFEALGVSADVVGKFSPEFLSGMAGEETRSRRLGDVQASAPSRWQWGGPGRTPHLLLLVYATADRLDEWMQAVKGESWDTAFRVLDSLPTSNNQGVEPFGFTDGISQPALDWNLTRRANADTQTEYGNLVALGEFVLGYPNEYAKYTDRPLLDAARDPSRELPAAADAPGKIDLGRNGTYLVLRHLRQDVRGFWQFLDKQANSRADVRRKLAEAMVGRTMSGEPLVPPAGRPIEGLGPDPTDVKLNQFTYQADAAGTRCPFGAHIRRANPRNADLPYGTTGWVSRLVRTLGFGRQGLHDDLVASTRFHRLLRRGRKYGAPLPPEQALQSGRADEDIGLYFISLNANIARQFEFVQNAWMMGTKFDGLSDESDPLLGNREPVLGGRDTSSFSLPRQDGARRDISGLPQFVTVRGGAYFFLPGIRALRYLARATS